MEHSAEQAVEQSAEQAAEQAVEQPAVRTRRTGLKMTIKEFEEKQEKELKEFEKSKVDYLLEKLKNKDYRWKFMAENFFTLFHTIGNFYERWVFNFESNELENYLLNNEQEKAINSSKEQLEKLFYNFDVGCSDLDMAIHEVSCLDRLFFDEEFINIRNCEHNDVFEYTSDIYIIHNEEILREFLGFFKSLILSSTSKLLPILIYLPSKSKTYK
jgi:hypothetical protein